jgi:hypothetical protein
MGGLRLGDLPTQTDVKSRWPDGSIRFAVLTAEVTRNDTYRLAEAAAVRGPFAPKVPAASVRLRVGDEYWTASLPAKPGSDVWLDGPLVMEWRALVVPTGAGGRPHPFLRVVWDVRVYRDGQSRLDVTVENALDRAGATKVTYDVAVVANGQTCFERPGVAHWYMTRWRKVFALGLSESVVRPDFEPFYEAGAVPRYLPLVSQEISRGSPAKFGPMQIGDLHFDMRDHGGRPELAPYPDWTARYLAHRSPEQQRYVLANGDLAGTWPVHLREPEDGRLKGVGSGRLISIDERPKFWLDSRNAAGEKPAGDLDATGPYAPDNAHVPSLAFVPYLVTGDRFYADETAFWANFGLLRTFQDDFYNGRGGSKGLLAPNETRGIAWVLRNLADAAAYLPDSDPVRDYLANKVVNNLKWADQYAESHLTPLGSYFEGQPPETASGKVWSIPRPWQNNYVAWSLDHAARQGFEGGKKLRDRLVAFQLTLFTSKDYDRNYAGPYTLFVGTKRDGGTIDWFNSLKVVFQETYTKTGSKATPFAGYYGVDARLMLLIARREGLPGATEAYEFLYPQITADLARRSGWAIAGDEGGREGPGDGRGRAAGRSGG